MRAKIKRESLERERERERGREGERETQDTGRAERAVSDLSDSGRGDFCKRVANTYGNTCNVINNCHNEYDKSLSK